MTHLTHDQLVALAEGAGSPAGDAHLRACAPCRAEVEGLREVLAALPAAAVPEPSPLFWDHFSRRVREAVEAEPVRPAAHAPWRWSAWPWAVASTAGVALAGVLLVQPVARPSPSPGARDVAAVTLATSAAPIEDNAGAGSVAPDEEVAGEDWTLVAEAADELHYDDMPGLSDGVRPGATDRAVLQLTTDQREELVRLLEQELARARQS
jgi:hypothetical protein